MSNIRFYFSHILFFMHQIATGNKISLRTCMRFCKRVSEVKIPNVMQEFTRKLIFSPWLRVQFNFHLTSIDHMFLDFQIWKNSLTSALKIFQLFIFIEHTRKKTKSFYFKNSLLGPMSFLLCEYQSVINF